MATIKAYLSFNGNCEEAFQFYGTVFKPAYTGIHQYSDLPPKPNMPPISGSHKNKVLHTAININEVTRLLGSDVIECLGQNVSYGNSTYIILDVVSPDEATSHFNAQTKDAQNSEMELGETFFAEQFASLQDKYGIYWMIHFEENKKFDHHGE